MFIFWRLLLAHFIADFPLQLDSIYRLKTKYPWGSFAHSGIFILSALVLLVPFWTAPGFWLFLLFLFIAHGFQDLLKIILTRQLPYDNIWLFLADQVLHILFIGTVLLLPFSSLRYAPSPDSIFYWYSLDKVIIYLVSIIGVGFGGSILIPYIEKLVKHLPLVVIPPPHKYQGVWERILVMLLVAVPGYYYIFVPVIFVIRYIGREKYSGIAVTVSILSAAILGWLLRVLA